MKNKTALYQVSNCKQRQKMQNKKNRIQFFDLKLPEVQFPSKKEKTEKTKTK